jgi:hypothetical protein
MHHGAQHAAVCGAPCDRGVQFEAAPQPAGGENGPGPGNVEAYLAVWQTRLHRPHNACSLLRWAVDVVHGWLVAGLALKHRDAGSIASPRPCRNVYRCNNHRRRSCPNNNTTQSRTNQITSRHGWWPPWRRRGMHTPLLAGQHGAGFGLVTMFMFTFAESSRKAATHSEPRSEFPGGEPGFSFLLQDRAGSRISLVRSEHPFVPAFRWSALLFSPPWPAPPLPSPLLRSPRWAAPPVCALFPIITWPRRPDPARTESRNKIPSRAESLPHLAAKAGCGGVACLG